MINEIGSTESLAASTTAVFSKVPTAPMKRFMVSTTGANNGLNTGTVGIDSMRVKVGGKAIIDMSARMLRAYLEAFAPGNYTPSTELRWPLPLNVDLRGGASLAIGIPASIFTVEVVCNGSGSAGAATLAYETHDRPDLITHVPNVVQFAGGQAASTNKNIVWIDSAGLPVYAVGVPLVSATGITRFKLVIQGRQICDFGQARLLSYVATYCPASVTAYVWFRLPAEFAGIVATKGDSFIETDTGAASAAGDEFALGCLQQIAAAA